MFILTFWLIGVSQGTARRTQETARISKAAAGIQPIVPAAPIPKGFTPQGHKVNRGVTKRYGASESRSIRRKRFLLMLLLFLGQR